MYAVGTDIVPGTYISAGPVQNGTCYWKRVGNGAGNDIIDNALSKKPQVVQIEATDKAFKTDGCQPWQKNDSATPDPGKSPAEAKLQLDILNALTNGGRSGGPAPAQSSPSPPSGPPPGPTGPAPGPTGPAPGPTGQ